MNERSGADLPNMEIIYPHGYTSYLSTMQSAAVDKT